MTRDETKDEKKSGRPHHTGSVAPEDEKLTLWLNRLWARGEPPERLEVWQMFGRNRATRGEMIFHEDFKPGDKLDVEQANRLANEIVEAAQNDCDSSRRERDYEIAIIDRNRRSSPLVRRLGPLQPKRTYALTKGDGEDNDDGLDGLDGRSLDLKFIQEGLQQSRWDKQRNDRIIGDVLTLLGSMVQELRADRHTLMSQQMAFFEKLQESQDRALDRELLREKEKFKLGLYKEGVRTARNLLPGLFGDGAAAAEPNGAANGHANGNNGAANGHTPGNPNVGNYGSSRERTLVDNFLNDCEEAEIAVAMFGDFEVRDGKLAQTKPGIFALEQFGILVGVRDGRLPPSALDKLLPNSGNKEAVTMDQIKAASDAGMTEGIGMALLEVVNLRRRRRETPPETPTETPAE